MDQIGRALAGGHPRRALRFRTGDAGNAAGVGQFAAIQGVAQSLGVDLTPVAVRSIVFTLVSTSVRRHT
jgi:hypothetical protein